MALPIVAGIVPVLLAIAKVFFAYRMVRTIFVIGTRLIIFAAMIAIFLLVLQAVEAALSGLAVTMPPLIQQGLSMFLPDNFAPCVSAIITCQVVIFLWHWKKYAVETVANGVT